MFKNLLLFSAFVLSSTAVNAATINASDHNWVQDNGTHNEANGNNITTGTTTHPRTGVTTNFRSYHLFDISSLTELQSTVSITFREGTGLYFADSTEVVDLFDVSSTTISQINSNYSSGSAIGQAIYSDVGGGTYFGSGSVSGTPDIYVSMPELTISLNAAGLNLFNVAIANSDQYFGIGVALATDDGNDFLWNSTASGDFPGSFLTTEVAPVPLPASALLLLGGLAGLAGLRRKKRT